MATNDDKSPGKPMWPKVLIANDSLHGIDIAIGKASKIEHYSGADLEVAEVIYDTVAEEPPTVLPRDQQAQLIENLQAAERNALARLIEPYRDKVATIDSRIIWDKHSTQGILDALGGVNLLIKPVSQHSQVVDRLQAPLDWALMRGAQCPVLVSKRDWVDTSIVVAAVDAADTEHEALNREILRVAFELSRILGARLHVVCAYPSLGQSSGELQVAMDYQGIKSDMRESRKQIVNTLVADLEVEMEELHLLEGKPGRVIPETANELGAAITVLGTAARRGLSQLLIGNTAERIIEAVEGDIVTVREPLS